METSHREQSGLSLPQFTSDGLFEVCAGKQYKANGTFYISLSYWSEKDIQKGQRTIFGQIEIFLSKIY